MSPTGSTLDHGHYEEMRPHFVKRHENLVSLEVVNSYRANSSNYHHHPVMTEISRGGHQQPIYQSVKKNEGVVNMWQRIRELSLTNFQSHLNLINKRGSSSGSADGSNQAPLQSVRVAPLRKVEVSAVDVIYGTQQVKSTNNPMKRVSNQSQSSGSSRQRYMMP